MSVKMDIRRMLNCVQIMNATPVRTERPSWGASKLIPFVATRAHLATAQLVYDMRSQPPLHAVCNKTKPPLTQMD